MNRLTPQDFDDVLEHLGLTDECAAQAFVMEESEVKAMRLGYTPVPFLVQAVLLMMISPRTPIETLMDHGLAVRTGELSVKKLFNEGGVLVELGIPRINLSASQDKPAIGSGRRRVLTGKGG